MTTATKTEAQEILDAIAGLATFGVHSSKAYALAEQVVLELTKRGFVIYRPYPDEVEFAKAKVGQTAYTYKRADGDSIDEFGWVVELDWFDDISDEMKLTRQRWRLVSEDELIVKPLWDRDDEEDDDDPEE